MASEVPVIEPLPPGNDRFWLALALVLTLVLRVALLLNTEVTAPDSVGFIRYALEFESKPWSEVVRGQHQHPAYPLLVNLASRPVRAIVGDTTPEAMRWSAQLVSLIACLLLVFPTYYLGTLLGHRAFGFAGAVLFQYLPVPAHNLSDGLTEATYLLFVASALWMLVRGVCGGHVWRFAAAGAFVGLAYLTRPEGAELLLVGLAMICLCQLIRSWRRSWSEAALALAAFAVAALAVGYPYYKTIGRFSNKPTTDEVRIEEAEDHDRSGSGQLLWAVNIPQSSRGLNLVGRAAFAILSEIDKNLFHHAWFGVFFGFVWLGRAYITSRASFGLALYMALHLMVLMYLGIRHRYVADRHVLPIVMLLCPISVAGMAYFCARIRYRVGRIASVEPRGYGALRVTFIVFLFFVLIGIPKAVQSLHGGRYANRVAGEWLAQRIQPEDDIVDAHGVASLYAKVLSSRRPDETKRFHQEVPAKLEHPTWVVVTRDRDQFVYDIRPSQERDLLEKKHAVMAYHWPENRPENEARVVIYRLAPQQPMP
jgi:hypothetical protein